MNFKLLIIILLIVIYAYGLLVKYLRLQSCKNSIPANVADIYDAETYEKWRAYRREKIRLSVADSTIALIADVVLVTFDLYAAFAIHDAENVVADLYRKRAVPRRIPMHSIPLASAVRATARTAAFMPGASPPLVKTPILLTFFSGSNIFIHSFLKKRLVCLPSLFHA